MLKIWVHCLIWGLFLAYSASTEASVFKVVIDPGHGGQDEGTVFKAGRTRVAEKDITLRLARQVAHQLRSKGFLVTLTRNKDREVTLSSRTALANQLGADIFISIHMNSTENTSQKDAEGIETFILNNATDASSRRLARLENSVISADPTYSHEQPDIALILKDLRLDANLSSSKRLACNIQGNLVSATSDISLRRTSHRQILRHRRNRGVKQALFHVLLGADMPSVLVEAGFLSNSKDRSIVLSPQGQRKISHAIAEAIDQYRLQKKGARGLLSLSSCKVN